MKLVGKKAAILVEDMYNEFEVWIPYYRLKEEGIEVVVVGSGTARTYHGKYGIPIEADTQASEVTADDFDALVIPGGYAPDKMRIHAAMVNLVKEMVTKGKVVACICHGGWMLVSAGVLKGRKATSYVAIRDDMVNAGALWEDSELVRDGNLITSRKPDDLPAFCRAMIQAMGE
ncbi:MAG: type 1 glutamine amidotransferase domain-containing protein [Desulfomonilaceae bacterium]|nr:type 1 glutamine amidotransferase domain-containing protein [Desulfomonilaceae bacterium]